MSARRSQPRPRVNQHADRPQVLPGFEHVNRYWDRQRSEHAAKILPGEYYVTVNGEMITTVLGSCVAACVCDPLFGIGGMNHFMLPDFVDGESRTWKETRVDSATRYGSFAMEHLINDVLKQGARRDRLSIKLFGGGQVLAAMTDIGKRNIEFVRGYMRTERLVIASEDLGGSFPRKVIYYPATGRAMVKRLRSLHNDTIVKRETSYLRDLEHKPVAGEIELF